MLSTVQQRKVQVLQCHAIQHVLQCSLQFCATVRCRVENGFYKQRAWSSGSSSYLVAAEPSKEAYSAFKQPARPCKVDILSSICRLCNPVRKLAHTSCFQLPARLIHCPPLYICTFCGSQQWGSFNSEDPQQAAPMAVLIIQPDNWYQTCICTLCMCSEVTSRRSKQWETLH